MKYLKIQNTGLLDIRLVALMGGTTKSRDKYKIGQFGTGLKYTLAYLFRNNLDFKIFIGRDEVKIHLEKETIRDEEFEIICIDGHRTSITTKMGEDWEAWMIVRELWCNALDEENPLKSVVEQTPIGAIGATTFYIQIDSQIQKVLDNWAKYFIHSQEAIFESEDFALYPAGEHLCLYKNGVLIKEIKEQKSVFSYDYKSADINELREFRGSVAMVVTWALCETGEKAATYFLENVTEEHYEGQSTTDYHWWRSWSDSWKNVIGEGKLIYPKILNDLKARGNEIDESKLIIVPEVLYRSLTKQFEGIGAVHVAGILGDFMECHDARVENRINQALAVLETCGYTFHPELTFKYGYFGDKSVNARIDLKNKKIYISIGMLQKPLFAVIAMLIEENEHFNTGMSDNTREFQQHFIDLYAKELLAKNQVEI